MEEGEEIEDERDRTLHLEQMGDLAIDYSMRGSRSIAQYSGPERKKVGTCRLDLWEHGRARTLLPLGEREQREHLIKRGEA